jgi:hypothetical protein
MKNMTPEESKMFAEFVRSEMAWEGRQMSNPIRINSRAIQCVADAEGATEYAIRYGGRDFIVTAHSRYDAEEAAEYYRPDTTDESQPDLLK